MARNGSGTYSLPEAAFVFNTVIDEAAVNNNFSDIATALTGSVAKDGQTTMTGALVMGSNKITGLTDGTAASDVAALHQIQDQDGIGCGTAGGTADALTLTPSPAITAYAAEQTFRFVSSAANTGAATVDVSGLGTKAIQIGGAALSAGDIPNGVMATITYDGTQFQLHSVSQAQGVTTKADLGLETTSADNAIVRFDSTAGNTQNSGVTIDDSDNVVLPDGATLEVDTINEATTDADVTVSGVVIGSSAVKRNGLVISANTTDGSDSSACYLGGGGTIGVGRGASVYAYGNEHANTGEMRLHGGNVAGGDIVFYTQNLERMRIAYDGTITGVGGWEDSDSVAASATSTLTITGITFNTEVLIFFDGIDNGSGADRDMTLQIGDSGGLETSGYLSQFEHPRGTTAELTSHIKLSSVQSGEHLYGFLRLLNITGNTWAYEGTLLSTGNEASSFSGVKTLSGTLDRFSVTVTPSNFQSGTIRMVTR